MAVQSHAPSAVRASHFLAGRGTQQAALSLQIARRQHLALLAAQPNAASLSAAWQPVGPGQVLTPTYGVVTGRVTALAIDPSDATGNTVYLGSTGGGVWKSTNAAGSPASVTFTPLTDTLPVFSANSGTNAIPSLSIGAVSVQPGIQNPVVLAGTGDPNDALDSYYGSGLLRSADGGSTWTLIAGSHDGVAGNHSFAGLGVAGFAWSTATGGLVVAAISDAAEGDLVNAPDSTNSVRGLYYSLDAGVTWQMATVRDGGQTVQTPLPSGQNQGGNAATAVVWNPIRARFYAAVRSHGYYESLDGVTWTRLAQQPGTTLTLAACPTNPGTLGNPACPLFRGALAVQPVTGDLFALTVDGSDKDQGLWQDVCAFAGSGCAAAVAFGQRLVSTPLEQGGGSTVIPQADYNMALAAVPSVTSGGNPDTLLFVGTSDLFRCSLAAGCALRNSTNATNACNGSSGVAGAQHAIAATATPALLYLGNDGGLWRSTDGVNQQATACSADDATHFQNLNGGLGSLAEVISFAQHPTDPNTLLAGFGANGTAATSSAFSSTVWAQLAPGEGGTVAIDPANPSNWYLSTAPGVSIAHCASGASCTAAGIAAAPTIGLSQVSDDGVLGGLTDPPWLLDPAAPTELLLGTCRVWRGPAANPASWNPSDAISPLLSGPRNSSCGPGNSVIRSLGAGGPASGAAAAQNAGSTVLYAGMAGSLIGGGPAGGHLFSTTAGGSANSGTAWTDLTGSPVTNGGGMFNPDGFDVSSIAVDAHDTTGKTVYATIMGFGVAHLYRSIDAGAHWINISGNLPDAPANSVVIDPNDANTAYVALDTGVYVTQQVATCATTNCWSVYGTGLPNAPVTGLAASASIANSGTFGTLRAATYGRGIWQLSLLTASAPNSQGAITLSATSLTFPLQQVATLSAAQTVTLTSTGSTPLTVNSVLVSGDFTQTNNCTGSPILPNATCAVQVSFQPTATGARSGLLTVYGNVPGGQATAMLNGTGTTGATLAVTPLTLTFSATTVGTTSAAQNITLSNTSATSVTLQSETVTGDFHLSANTCGATLAPNTGCTVAVVFTPTVSGSRTGSLTVADSLGTQTASLNGTGTLPATDALSPLTLAFAAQVLNTASAAQQVTLTNSGDVALTLIGAQTSGDFTVVNSCGNSLNAHSSCALQVAFVPKNLGGESGVLTVSDQFRTQTVALSGTGIAPPGFTLAPFGGLSFGVFGVGLTSPAQTVTLTNNGGSTLTLNGFTTTGDFSIPTGGTTCGTTLVVNAACAFQVVFRPAGAGPRSGTLTVTSSAAPQTLALTGTGVDFSLTASNTTATVASGASAVYGLLLNSATGVPGTAAFTCTGAPANATCLVVPTSVPLGTGTATVTVTVATGVATAALAPTPRIFWLAGLLPLGLLLLRKARFFSLLLIFAAGVGLATTSGCGASRTVPATTTSPTGPTVPTPTPAGTSTIVVSATSAGLSRTVNLTLTVQ